MRPLLILLLSATALQAGCLSQTTISGLDLAHSSFLATPINQPYHAGATATAQLDLRRSDDQPLAGATVRLHSERCGLDPNAAAADANGRVLVRVIPATAQGCSVDAVVLFQGTQTAVPSTAAVNFYLPADGNASVLPGQQLDLQATARRADGLVNTQYTGTVRVSATDSNATLPADYAFTASDYGNKIWLAGLVLRTSGVQSVRVADAATGQPLQPDLQVEVQAGQAISLQLQASVGAVAGEAYSALARVVDSYGDSVKGYTGTVRVTSSDPCATLPGPQTFAATDAGSKALPGIVWRTSGQQLLQVTDTQNDALLGQALVEVAPAGGQQLRVSAVAATVAGLPIGMSVEIVDAYGNVVPSATAQLHFASSDPLATLPADTPIGLADSGRVSVTGLTLVTAGDQNITVADATGALASNSQPLHVEAGAATRITLDSNVQTRAGAAQDVRVQAFDTYGNLASGFTGTVGFTGSDLAAQYPIAYRFGSQDGGSHVFPAGMTFVTSGDQNLRVSVLGGSLQAQLPHVMVQPADPNRLSLSGLAPIHVACVAESPTVAVYDVYGNVVTDFTGTLTFSSASNSVGLPASVTLSASDAGMKSLPGGVTPYTSGTGYITIAAGPITSNQTLAVQPGAVSWIEAKDYRAHVAPASTQVTVLAHDACNNVVTQTTDTLHFTSSDPCALLPQDYTFVANDNGQHTFGFTLATLGPQTLTIADQTNTQVTAGVVSTQVYYPCTPYGQSMNSSVGGVAQAAGIGGNFTTPIVALDSNQTPTAAWTDSRSGEARAYVATYNAGSQTWQGLGGSAVALGFSGLDGTVGPVSLAMWHNQPWVAWSNLGVSAAGSTVQLASYNGAWAGQGSNANDSSAAPGISGSASALVDQVHLAMSSGGTPYVAWRNTADGSIRLRRFASAQWLGLGSSDLVSAGPDASDGGLALALTSADQPTVAWQAKPGSAQQIYLAQWSGSSWQGLAGSDAGAGLSNASSDAAHPALLLDANDLPWVAWDVQASTNNREIYARHWSGSAWTEAGGSASNGGISANASASIAPALALASNNQPVVAWEDTGTGDHAIFLKRYDGSAWAGVQRSDVDWGISAQFGTNATRPQMVLDSSDRPVVAFTAHGGWAFVCRWASVAP